MAFRNKYAKVSTSLGPKHYDRTAPNLLDELAVEHATELVNARTRAYEVAAGDWKPPALPDLSRHTDIRLDAETTGLRWHSGDRPIGWSLYLPATKESFYFPIGHVSGNMDPETVREWMRREIRGKHILNITMKFDLHMARVDGVDLTRQGNTFSDVSFYAGLLDDHRHRFNLDELVTDFLPPETAKKLKETQGFSIDKTRMASYPAGLIAPYAEYDVILVDMLHGALWPKLQAEGLLDTLALENAVIPAVVEMESNGAPLDIETLDRWIVETQQELEQALFKIQKRTGIRFETPDTRDAILKLFSLKKIPIPRVPEEEGGGETFADVYLEQVPDEDVQLLRFAKQVASLRSKFLVKYRRVVDSRGILHYNLNQLPCVTEDGETKGTVSGRFSSSGSGKKGEEYGVNIQQVISVDRQKKRSRSGGEAMTGRWIVKKLFKPAEGVWCSTDAKQIEYRLFAHYANSDALIAAYRKDPLMDFHQTVGNLLATKRDGLIRQEVKSINFAQIYGAGLAKFCKMLGIEEDAGKELLEIYHGMFPEVKPLLNRASQFAKPECDSRCGYSCSYKRNGQHRGYVRTITGRRARFGATDRHYSALNRIIQGSAADIMKRVLAEVYTQRDQIELTMRMTVHDAIDGDLRNPDKLKVYEEILNTQYYPTSVPILWETGTGQTWAEAK